LKHFKFVERGKRRLHDKPKSSEIRACSPWLREEVSLVRPHLIVALGATASASLFDAKVRVMRDRGRVISLALSGKAASPSRSSSQFTRRQPCEAPPLNAGGKLREMLIDDLTVAQRAASSRSTSS
jgi:DNA polymerase